MIAPDLIGYGRTDSWPDGHGFPVDDELRLLEPLLPPAPAGVHVVGHSYGGVVALHLALAGRVPIRSLTLIEPVAFFLLPHAGAQTAWLEIKALGEDLCGADRGGGNGNGAARLHRLLGGRAAPGTRWMNRCARRSAGARERSSSIFEVTFTDPGMEALRALKCPVRLISGGCSRIPTQRIAAFLAEQIPGATLEVVDDANHLLPVTHPTCCGASCCGNWRSDFALQFPDMRLRGPEPRCELGCPPLAVETAAFASADVSGTVRHDWTREQVRALFELPFPELIFRAQSIHRRHFDPSRGADFDAALDQDRRLSGGLCLLSPERALRHRRQGGKADGGGCRAGRGAGGEERRRQPLLHGGGLARAEGSRSRQGVRDGRRASKRPGSRPALRSAC